MFGVGEQVRKQTWEEALRLVDEAGGWLGAMDELRRIVASYTPPYGPHRQQVRRPGDPGTITRGEARKVSNPALTEGDVFPGVEFS